MSPSSMVFPSVLHIHHFAPSSPRFSTPLFEFCPRLCVSRMAATVTFTTGGAHARLYVTTVTQGSKRAGAARFFRSRLFIPYWFLLCCATTFFLACRLGCFLVGVLCDGNFSLRRRPRKD